MELFQIGLIGRGPLVGRVSIRYNWTMAPGSVIHCSRVICQRECILDIHAGFIARKRGAHTNPESQIDRVCFEDPGAPLCHKPRTTLGDMLA